MIFQLWHLVLGCLISFILGGGFVVWWLYMDAQAMARAEIEKRIFEHSLGDFKLKEIGEKALVRRMRFQSIMRKHGLGKYLQ